MKINDGNVTNNVMVVESLPKYIAKNYYTYVIMEDIESCIQLVGGNKMLCTLKGPKISVGVESCALAMVANSSEMAKGNCEYVITNFPTGYYAIAKQYHWFVFITNPVIGTINCPNSSEFKNRPLKNFVGTIVISPPCSLTSTKFSLPTINTAIGNKHYDPIRTLQHEQIFLDNNTNLEPNRELTALSGDIEVLRNLSKTRHQILTDQLKTINDTTVIHQTAYSFVTGILIILVIILVCAFRFRRSLCPCSFLSVFSKHKRTRRQGDENLNAMAQELTEVRGQLREITRQRETVSPFSEISHVPNELEVDEVIPVDLGESEYDDVENLFVRMDKRQPCILKTPPRKPKRLVATPLAIPSVAAAVDIEEGKGTIRKKGRGQPVESVLFGTDREISPPKTGECGYLQLKVNKVLESERARKLETITEL